MSFRALHITPALFGHGGIYGGVERYSYELARHIARVTPATLVSFGERSRRFTTADGLNVCLLGPPSRGFLPPEAMAENLGETADALFLPKSFEPLEHVNVATPFPSKLTDNTASALPILILGAKLQEVFRDRVQVPSRC